LRKDKSVNGKIPIISGQYSDSSEFEGEIINKLHDAIGKYKGIVINPGAYTHYSIAIRDAIEILDIPVIEVHLSNIYNREEFRQKSVIAPVCEGQISGFGHSSYLMGIQAIKYIIGGTYEL